MMPVWKLVLFIIVSILLYEGIIGLMRKVKRRKVFALAQKRAAETGYPLLVIGDPYNGIMSISTGPDYECGDVCLDLTGCPKCPKGIKGRLEEIIPTIDLEHTVVYISCVLEYVDDLELILRYLRKIDVRNLFIVNVEWYSLTAYLYPYYITKEEPPKFVIYKCPPWNDIIVYKRFSE